MEVIDYGSDMVPRATPSHGAGNYLIGTNDGPPQTHTQDGSLPPSIETRSLDLDQAEEADVNEGVYINSNDENIETLDDHG